MLLKHVAIRDFAGIAEQRIEAIEPGLTVLVGDNEAGKSTILTALRAAIFHRHGSQSRFARDLAPYGRQVRPEVDLEFAVAGTDYRLEKRFLQRPEARLAWAGGELTGDAVEERLAQLFGFSPFSGRGEFDGERHQGAFGLLWVEQGRSGSGIDIGVGRDAVAASLEAEVGQILGGEEGRELILAAKSLRDRHFTEGGLVKKNAALRVAEEELAALDASLSEKRALKVALDKAIDRLADRRGRLAAYARDGVLAAAEAALAVAEGAERERDERRRDVTEATQELEIRRAGAARAADDLVRREAMAAENRAAASRQAALEGALGSLRAETLAGAQALERCEGTRAAALEASRLAESRRRDEEARRERARLERERAQLARALEEARRTGERVAAARARLSAVMLDEKTYRAVLDAEAARRDAAAGRDAGAPTVVFRPDGEQAVAVAGDEARAVPPSRPVSVSRRTVFRLSGFGQVELVPDSGSASREAVHEKAAARLDALLRRGDLADVEAAHEARRGTVEAEADLREALAELRARAPDGLGALEGALDALVQALAALPGPSVDSAGEDAADPEAARDALNAAEDALTAARRESEDARARLVRGEAATEAAAGEAARLSRALGEAEAHAGEATLRERVAAAELARRAQEAVLGRLRADYAAADPEAIELELRRARGALHHARADIAASEGEVRALEAELRVTGGQGLGEAIVREEEERVVLDERVGRLRLEADAALLLYDTLRRAEGRAREKWFAPIRDEIAPFMRLIHPNTEVAFDDATLAVTGLRRGGVSERFERLSAGAREQVAVVTRLAFAQVLKRGGHPAAVILDDALVNTDEKRLGRMHLVLQKAAEALQIIVLTCRESDFRGLGAAIRRL